MNDSHDSELSTLSPASIGGPADGSKRPTNDWLHSPGVDLFFFAFGWLPLFLLLVGAAATTWEKEATTIAFLALTLASLHRVEPPELAVPDVPADVAVGTLRLSIPHFGSNVPQILQAIQREDSATITQRDIYDLVALPKIHEGLVVLAGDAAHAMTPNLGQGACQAIEDAVAIAQLLDEHRNDLVAGGRAYQVLRMTRAQAISRRSRQLGFVATLESPVACWLRDTIMSTLQRARGKNI